MLHPTRSRAPALLGLTLTLTLLPLWARVALASDDASACAVFARVLAKARASGALERALGEHDFLLRRTFYGPRGDVGRITSSLMTYRVSAPEGGGLTVVVEVLPEARSGAMRFTYTVGDDGRLLGLETEHPQGRSQAHRDPAGDLALASFMGRPRGDRVPWDDAILPKIVGSFLLPMWHDQGLPTSLTFRDVTPFARLGAPAVLRRLEDEGEGATFVTDEGGPEPTTVVEVAPAAAGGRVTSIRTRSWFRRGGGLQAVWESARIDPARAAELRAAWAAAPKPPR